MLILLNVLYNIKKIEDIKMAEINKNIKINEDIFLEKLNKFINIKILIEDLKITSSQNLEEKYIKDWRGKYHQKPLLMVQPKNTKALQLLVKFCQEHNYQIALQGGNTSLCGGSIAENQQQILVNLALMNNIRKYDDCSKTAIVEAGCTLAEVQNFAKQQGAFYPLSLPSEQYCTIGGNLSTNAGGVAVLRYGNSRQLCLGLEVVLPNGELYQGLYQLQKNNMAYDLKHLFIGAEGTLGIITAAALQFFEAPKTQHVYLFACQNITQIMQLFKKLKNGLSPLLTGFELMNQDSLICVEKYIAGNLKLNNINNISEVFKNLENIENIEGGFLNKYKWYALCEISEYALAKFSETDLYQMIFDEALLADISILKINNINNINNDKILQIKNNKNNNNLKLNSENLGNLEDLTFWQIRHSIPAAQKFFGGNLKHDISVKIDDIAYLINQLQSLILQVYPKAYFILFGHVGDGNIHFNVDISNYKNEFENKENKENLKNILENIAKDISNIIYTCVKNLNGSIAAEHAIGQLKKELLKNYIPKSHYDLMQTLKTSIDPQNTLNSHVIFLN